MEKFTQLTGIAAPMPMINIDTDKIFIKAGFELREPGCSM